MNKGLKDVKDFVEAGEGKIKKQISKEDSEELKKTLEKIGCKIELK